MAQVTELVHRRIQELLDLLTWQWQRLPEVEAEIDRWDLLDQLNFIEEWPLEEERLKRLEEYLIDGALTQEQLAQYEHLKGIMAQNQPIIRRLRES